MRRLGTTLVLLTLATIGIPVAAHARSAENGRIFYSAGAVLPDPDLGAGSQIWSVNPDGSDAKQLTSVAAPAEAGGPDVSADGTRVLYVSNATGPFQVWTMRADGTRQHLLIRDRHYDAFVPRWSADGTRLIFTRCSAPFGFIECTIAVADADGTDLHDVTTPRWADFTATFAPDGSSIAYSGDRYGYISAIYRKSLADGRQRRLTPPTREAFWPDYRADGRQILFGDNFDRPTTNLWTMRANGSDAKQITSITAPDSNFGFARYSPDGRQIASDYVDSSGEWLVTMDADGSNFRKVIETGNLTLSDWAVSS